MMVSSWIDIHFLLSWQVIGIHFLLSCQTIGTISSPCRDSKDFMSFLFILYIPDLVRKSLPEITSYLVQDGSFLLIDVRMKGIFAMADKVVAATALWRLSSESDASF